MYRRQFLRACGFTGLFHPTNWRTFVRGPKIGCVVHLGIFRRRYRIMYIAGAPARDGESLYFGREDGLMYPSRCDPSQEVGVVGIALSSAESRGDLMSLRFSEPGLDNSEV